MLCIAEMNEIVTMQLFHPKPAAIKAPLPAGVPRLCDVIDYDPKKQVFKQVIKTVRAALKTHLDDGFGEFVLVAGSMKTEYLLSNGPRCWRDTAHIKGI
jgi:DNA primase